MNELILGVLWLIYYAIHSLMASRGFKRYLRVSIPLFYPYYRLVYSTFAGINLVLLIWLHLIIPSSTFIYMPYLSFIGYGLCLFSAIVLVAALRSYGADFLVREINNKSLVRTGLNAYVRHPLYSGILLFCLGLVMVSPTWKNLTFAAVTAIYLFVGTKLEEQKLLKDFGDEYLEYQNEVKMLIPWIF